MSGLKDLLEQIRALEKKVSEEANREAQEFGYSLRRGRVRFEDEVSKRHRQLKVGLGDYIRHASLPVAATGPLVYSLIIPLLALDFMASIFQWICFPVYRVPRVKRSDYFIYDRHRLKYLNIFERFNCRYCSYANGLLAYVTEIGGRTEQFWCPVKHAQKIKDPHSRYSLFFSYGDAERYATELQSLRRQFGDFESQQSTNSDKQKDA